jgi:hypothetical protein
LIIILYFILFIFLSKLFSKRFYIKYPGMNTILKLVKNQRRRRKMKEKITLEKVVDTGVIAVRTPLYVAGAVAALAAVAGGIGVGIYEGATGQKIFGAENPSMIMAAGAGYAAQLIPCIATQFHTSDEMSYGDDEAILGGIICPIGPIAGMLFYGMGYGIGKLFA